jgi:hypothetical protein
MVGGTGEGGKSEREIVLVYLVDLVVILWVILVHLFLLLKIERSASEKEDGV